jgi:integrase
MPRARQDEELTLQRAAGRHDLLKSAPSWGSRWRSRPCAALYVRQGKGRKDRVVPIQPEVDQLLRAYLASTGRRLGQMGPLFCAHDRGFVHRGVQRGRLGAGAVWAVVQVCAVAASINAKKVSRHALRHTMALRTLRNSRDVMAVKELLGHAALSTTQRYLAHLQLAELRRAVPALPVAGLAAEASLGFGPVPGHAQQVHQAPLG